METNQEQSIQPVVVPSTESRPDSNSKYQPVSTWGYIGIMLLLGIPIIGPILAIVWALGGCRKVNKRNFARASLIVSVFLLAVSLALGLAVKKVVTEAIEEIETSITMMNKAQSGEIDLNSLEDLGELEEAMTMLDGLSEEDLGVYEDALSELFSDFEFEKKEE